MPHVALGLDSGRVRHAEQRFRFRRPLRARSLDATVSLANAFSREGAAGGLVFAVVETEFVDVEGVVATSEMTLVEVPPSPPVAKNRPADAHPAPAPRLRRHVRALGLDDLQRYADVSGDRNPIHLDAEAARAAGLPQVVVMGMLPAGMLGVLAVEAVDGQTPVELSFRFVRPIWPGESLELEAWPADDGGDVALRVSAAGEPRITGSAVPRREP